MIYRAESSFQPMWMRRKDFCTSPKDLVHRLGYWQCINRWGGTRNYQAEICKTHCKEQEMTPYIAVHRVHKAKSRLAVGIQQHKTNTAGSGYREVQ